MIWIIWQWLRDLFRADPDDDDDDDDGDYMAFDFLDETPEGFHPCDTQPTSPGLLDTLPGRLE